MKKFYFIPILIIILLSCQHLETEFSCNPEINEFVIENQEELSQITIEELSSYDIKLQRAIFNSWNYQKKRKVWIDKLSYVLKNESFTKAEIDHIHLLIQHINENYFTDEKIRGNLALRSLFANEWINYAMNKLGWPEEFVAFMVYRLYTDQTQFEAELSGLRSLGTDITTNSEGDCDCNIENDFCDTLDCRSTGCNTTPSGCGWLWSMPCDGNCY